MSVEQADGSGSVPILTAEIVNSAQFQYNSLGLSSRRIHLQHKRNGLIELSIPLCRETVPLVESNWRSSIYQLLSSLAPSLRAIHPLFVTNVSSEDALVLLVAPSRAMQH